MSTHPVFFNLTIDRYPHRKTPFHFTLTANGQPLRSQQLATRDTFQELHQRVDGYRQLLMGRATSTLAEPALMGVGTALFELWISPFWHGMERTLRLGQPAVLSIVSTLPELLNLPWELLQLPGTPPVGIKEHFWVRRLIQRGTGTTRSRTHPLPHPLKILFASGAGSENPGLPPVPDPETQAFAKIMATIDHGQAINLPGAVPLTQLRTIFLRFQPHVVHLSGTALIKGETGFFVFSDGSGETDIRSAAEITDQLSALGPIPLLLFSGRNPNRPPPIAATGALCQGTAISGAVQQAIAWPETLENPIVGAMAKRFYQAITAGKSGDQALILARQRVFSRCQQIGCPLWSLPVLYGGTELFPRG